MTSTKAGTGIRAALYTRISSDPTKQGLGIERQEADGRATARRHGWSVVAVYPDNDRSATNGRLRPEFQRMIRDFEAGNFEAVVVWNSDRLTRDVIEGEQVIKLAQERGLRLANVAGETDLSTADGRTMFRIKVALSKAETERASERIKRQRDQAAEQGRPHGMVAFGYRRVHELDDDGRIITTRDVIDAQQADLIRETAKRLLVGDSLRSIARSLNERGSTTPKGTPWSSTTLRQVMLRDRNAGLRRHRGRVIGKAAWEPIYDEGTHNRVKALLTDPSRTSGRGDKGATRKHLLSSIARCGLCGGCMRSVPGSVYRGKTITPKYQCKECMKVARKQELVDDIVTETVIARLQRPDAVRALATGRPERAEELQQMIAEAKARLDLAADGFADGTVTGDQLRRIGAKLTPQVDTWQAELATCAPLDGLLDMTGPDAGERWHAAPLDRQRAVLDMLMWVTILPTGPGRRFNEDDVRVEDDGRVIVFSESVRIAWRQA